MSQSCHHCEWATFERRGQLNWIQGKDAAELKATLENTFGLVFFLESKSLKPTGREKINIENRRKAKAACKTSWGTWTGSRGETNISSFVYVPTGDPSILRKRCNHWLSSQWSPCVSTSLNRLCGFFFFFYLYLQMTLDVIPTGRRVLNSSKVPWGKPHLRSSPLNLLMRAYTAISSDSRR